MKTLKENTKNINSILIIKSTSSGFYESWTGELNNISFRIGRNLNKLNLFQEDLKGNLTKVQVSEIFEEIDRLRKTKQLL